MQKKLLSAKQVKSLSKLLEDKPRDRALFHAGIDSMLRSSDLRQLRVEDVVDSIRQMTTQTIADELIAELGFQVDDCTIVVAGDTTALGLRSGDLAVVRPVNGHDGEGVYLVSFDSLELLRCICQNADRKYTLRCDNRLHYPGDYAVF